jgi:hypothetical protein
MNAGGNKTVVLCKAGLSRWGVVSQKFAQVPRAVSILIDHDGTTPSQTWEDELSHLELRWAELREVLDKVLPGGGSAATLETIDLRSHIRPSRAILHFQTTQDVFDWFVRLSEDCTIESAGPED